VPKAGKPEASKEPPAAFEKKKDDCFIETIGGMKLLSRRLPSGRVIHVDTLDGSASIAIFHRNCGFAPFFELENSAPFAQTGQMLRGGSGILHTNFDNGDSK